MVFSSIAFLFAFLPFAFLFVHLSPRKLQNLSLLAASLAFYAWGEGVYVVVMLLSICINYCFGCFIGKATRQRFARVALAFGILCNLGLLVSFKYSNFLVDIFNIPIRQLGLTPFFLKPVHLPIGISFFTFQGLSYLIDVYRNPAILQRNPVNLALYISLFPQLIAGPIVRYTDIAREIESRRTSFVDVAAGFERFIVGLAKKVMIANVLAAPVDLIFGIPSPGLTPSLAWIGISCYALQIYFDFSGYSDMAIGLGRMFGFHFNENFNAPYLSRSIQEFWRRWHISLSTWFRDYLYIPLGGSRKGLKSTYLHLLIVFILCGLWHGANWTFIVWGLFHGGFLILERMGWSRTLKALPAWVCHVYVLLVVVVGWVFFRSDSMQAAWYYLGAMFGGIRGDSLIYGVSSYVDGKVMVAFVAGCLVLLLERSAIDFWKTVLLGKGEWISVFSKEPILLLPLRLFGIAGLTLLCLMELAAGSYNPFIYFRF